MKGFHKVVTTLWLLFFIIQTTPSPLKPFIRPADIERATRPFANKFVYVDKTKHFSTLFNEDGFGQTYFFVRPRRFGKSTFLRTLQRILDGTGRGVFNGTYIHGSNYSWEPYPVLYLDFGNSKEMDCHRVMLKNQTRFQSQMDGTLEIFKKEHHLLKPKYSEVVDEFQSILLEMSNEKKKLTVVLIDEYDLPVLSNMKDCPAAELINKARLEAIFQVLKTQSGCVKFAFVTGVSRAVFRSFISPPDLVDISDSPEFHEIAGITESDLNTTYTDHIADIAQRENENNVTGILKSWYDGYQFAVGSNVSRLYSPLSVHGYFRSGGVAKPYYDDEEHAGFLFEQIVKRPDEFSSLNLTLGVPSDLKGGSSLDETTPEVLLYDAGYLTIVEREGRNGYLLQFPNLEMEMVFHRDIAQAAMRAKNSIAPEIRIIGDSLKKETPDFDSFIRATSTALMKLRARPKYEKWYHHETGNFMVLAKIRFIDLETPIKTKDFGNRKPDITGYDAHTCFLFEIKYERSPREACAQANKSITTFLGNETLCGTDDKNLLAAGITFTSNVKKDVVKAYQAKLLAPNGTVLKRYPSSALPEGIGTVFSSDADDLFVKSSE